MKFKGSAEGQTEDALRVQHKFGKIVNLMQKRILRFVYVTEYI